MQIQIKLSCAEPVQSGSTIMYTLHASGHNANGLRVQIIFVSIEQICLSGRLAHSTCTIYI